MSTSATAPLETAIDAPYLHKGKATNRSWSQLPAEIIRQIATHFIVDLQTTVPIPHQWDARKLWFSKLVFANIRTTLQVERTFMSLCPEWTRAISHHSCWHEALHCIDQNSFYAFHLIRTAPPHAPLVFHSPYDQFRAVISRTCCICRINSPQGSAGFGTGEHTFESRPLGWIRVCADHVDKERRSLWCGACLRSPPLRPPHPPQPYTVQECDALQYLYCAENDDEETWPRVHTTCRKCRTEALVRRVTPVERQGLGGSQLNPSDPEIRHLLEMYLGPGEVTLSSLLARVREKQWLRAYTKYDSLGEHAIAAHQSVAQPDEEEEDMEEDDTDYMLIRDAGQIRDLALSDWARQRVLDGFWVSPADQYYQYTVPGQPVVVPAIHPCPWAKRVVSASRDASMSQEESHPTRSTYSVESVPTRTLANQLYHVHIRTMREVLLPVLRNVVRKVSMECMIPTDKGFYPDPAVRVSKMSLEEVVAILRTEEGVWYDGVDWVERKRQEVAASSRDSKERALLGRKEDDLLSTSSSSSRSDNSIKTPSAESGTGSTTTSPVLSTSTLQTTPSPPPSTDDNGLPKDDTATNPSTAPFKSPISPLRSLRPLTSSIPFIPVTIKNLPEYSMEALYLAWRSACAPLYACSCSICQRTEAMKATTKAQVTVYNTNAHRTSQQGNHTPTNIRTYAPQKEIQLREAADIDGDGEIDDYDGLDYDSDELDDDLEDEEEEEEALVDHNDHQRRHRDYRRYSTSPEVVTPGELEIIQEEDHQVAPSTPTTVASVLTTSDGPPARRKRSCEVLDDEAEDMDTDYDRLPESLQPRSAHPQRRDPREISGGTPPKKARVCSLPEQVDDDITLTSTTTPSNLTVPHAAAPGASPPVSPSRQRKRSSEELEDVIPLPSLNSKRVKVDLTGGGRSPLTESPTDELELEHSTATHAGSAIPRDMADIDTIAPPITPLSNFPPTFSPSAVNKSRLPS